MRRGGRTGRQSEGRAPFRRCFPKSIPARLRPEHITDWLGAGLAGALPFDRACVTARLPSGISFRNPNSQRQIWRNILMGESTLIASTAKLTRQQLSTVATPLGTATHRPVPHAEIVEALVETLSF